MDARAELIATLAAHLPGALIALDFDGTLSPLVDRPGDSRLADGALEAIEALAAAGAHVAVVTGRDAMTVLELSGLGDIPGLSVDGLYGAERWIGGRLETLPDHPALDAARAELPALLSGEPSARGVWTEDKRLSLVLHARTAADPGAAMEGLGRPVLTLAGRVGLELHLGRDVLELRLPGYDKGGVLRRLVDERRPGAVLYAGDDLGDLPAFDVIADLRSAGIDAWSVAAGDPPLPRIVAAADVAVSGPGDLVGLLAEVAAASSGETPATD